MYSGRLFSICSMLRPEAAFEHLPCMLLIAHVIALTRLTMQQREITIMWHCLATSSLKIAVKYFDGWAHAFCCFLISRPSYSQAFIESSSSADVHGACNPNES